MDRERSFIREPKVSTFLDNFNCLPFILRFNSLWMIYVLYLFVA